MEATFKQGRVAIEYIDSQRKPRKSNLENVGRLDDWERLTNIIILYLSGKADSTISSSLNKIKYPLSIVIDLTDLKSLPTNADDWSVFIKNLYLVNISQSKNNSAITTRVDNWNKILRPFLSFAQDKDLIPVSVKIPAMKKVGENNDIGKSKSTIGKANKPTLTSDREKKYDKIYSEIDLSRTDSDYLDELEFDLERKREKLFSCLKSYWEAIKSHYDFAQDIIDLVPNEYRNELERIKNNDIYDYVKRATSKQRIPPMRECITRPYEFRGFCLHLYLLNEVGGVFHSKLRSPFPNKRITAYNANELFFPYIGEELESTVSILDRLGWCMGVLSSRDVSFISALLILLNPKFNPQPLLFSKIVDKHNKPYLEINDEIINFSVNKERAKSPKTENLDPLSYEIISTLIDFKSKLSHLIEPHNEKMLFLALNQKRTELVTPSTTRFSSNITGYGHDGGYTGTSLSTIFPSLLEYDLGPGKVSHYKIRATEGVLEWLRTGSVAVMADKMGNTSKVVIDNYLPPTLHAAYITRTVRKMQNLFIIASTIDEDYLLEATDFRALEDVVSFVLDMLEGSEKSKSPIMDILKGIDDDTKENKLNGKVITSISVNALTALLLFREAAISSSVATSVLAKKHKNSDISPLSLIILAKYLSVTLRDNRDSKIRQTYNEAINRADSLKEKVQWGSLFIKSEKLS